MDQLADVEAAAPAVLAIPEFDAGFRYEDFNEATDAKADYGIAGLVGGAAAAAALAKNGGFLAGRAAVSEERLVPDLRRHRRHWRGLSAAFFNRKPKTEVKAEQRAATAFFDGPRRQPEAVAARHDAAVPARLPSDQFEPRRPKTKARSIAPGLFVSCVVRTAISDCSSSRKSRRRRREVLQRADILGLHLRRVGVLHQRPLHFALVAHERDHVELAHRQQVGRR